MVRFKVKLDAMRWTKGWEWTYLESVRLVMVSPLAQRSEGLSHSDDNDNNRYFRGEKVGIGLGPDKCNEALSWKAFAERDQWRLTGSLKKVDDAWFGAMGGG